MTDTSQLAASRPAALFAALTVALTSGLLAGGCGDDDRADVAECWAADTVRSRVAVYAADWAKHLATDDIVEGLGGDWSYSDLMFDSIDGGNPLFDANSTPGPPLYYDGDTLIIDGAFRVDDGPFADGRSQVVQATVLCVWDRIDLEPAVERQIQQTRALDGLQRAESNGYDLAWTYHPDDGLFMTIDR